MAGSGSNQICSCYYHEMKGHGYFEEGVQVGHIVVAADNCGGQNKNKTMVQFCKWIHECGVAKKVTLLFLMKGRTKNICDCLFNLVKHEYHDTNIYSEDALDASLGKHPQITLRRLTEDDFFDFESFLYDFYVEPRDIEKYHIFTFGMGNTSNDLLKMRDALATGEGFQWQSLRPSVRTKQKWRELTDD